MQEYWFLKPKKLRFVSIGCYVLSFMALFLTMLDFRGEEEKIKSTIPDQKTIIVIDSSLSMLTEDVRPSRYLKAIQLARHFVKNTVMSQYSLFIFSDGFQRVLPFTDDVDLVDARLSALETLTNVKGSSHIGATVSNMVSYLVEENSNENPVGNILLITDGEDQDTDEKLNIPKNVNLAVVGIETVKGSQLPLRFNGGDFRGFKTSEGKPVVSRLNEDYIKGLGRGVENFNYWIVNSFNLPSEEIKIFFEQNFLKTNNVGEVRSRKAYGEFGIIVFVIFFSLANILNQFKGYRHFTPIITLMSSTLLYFLMATSIYAADEMKQSLPEKENEPKVSEETLQVLSKVRNGEASQRETLKAAEGLLKDNFPETAKKIYEENLQNFLSSDQETKKSTFLRQELPKYRANYGTSLVKSEDVDGGIKIYKDLLANKNIDSKLRDDIRRNLLAAIQLKTQNDERQKNESQNQSQNQSQDQSQDQSQENEQGKNENQNDSKKQEGQKQENQNQGKDNGQVKGEGQGQKKEGQEKGLLKDLLNKNSSKEEASEKKQDQPSQKNNDPQKENSKEDENKSEGLGQGSQYESFKEKEERLKRSKRMKKTSGILQQTLDQDRDLQRKFFDASSDDVVRDKSTGAKRKDW